MSGLKVGICGCGWLGQPLASHLLGAGHHVVGTKRQPTSAQALSETLATTVVPFDVMAPDYHQAAPLLEADIVVINIAAGRRHADFDAYRDAMCAFIDRLAQAGVEHVLFISTTSVYGALQGKVTEQTATAATTASGKAHEHIEAHLRETYGEKGTIMRLAGLIGGERHPSTMLAGRQGLSGGNEPVNLIHRSDVIAAISAIIHQRQWGHTFHLCAELHPSKSVYYSWAAREMGLQPPEYQPSTGNGKWIDASQTLAQLGLNLRYASPYQMIADGQVTSDDPAPK
ncbi:NAD(P)H-binding protein [Salinivibrio kushneri]|uniref:NAD(P)H-binding protein n=1 Tax=Salinivibrio kushneri TaxID=1908198 RepID=UPI0009892420|nr:NAD(P)H-binding protein [Salinivibrio kushneri]